MKTTSVILLCMLATFSVLTVQARTLKLEIDDQVEGKVPGKAGALPGTCWLCKWALNKVRKGIQSNATEKIISSKLLAICNQAGLLKAKCNKFVNRILGQLIEELSTTDDVRTICFNVRACKPKDLDLVSTLEDEDSPSDMIMHVLNSQVLAHST